MDSSSIILCASSMCLMRTRKRGSGRADSPASEAWPAPPERSWLEWLLLFGGGTLGLFVLVSLFGLLTARNNYVPPPPSTDLEVAPGNEAARH